MEEVPRVEENVVSENEHKKTSPNAEKVASESNIDQH